MKEGPKKKEDKKSDVSIVFSDLKEGPQNYEELVQKSEGQFESLVRLREKSKTSIEKLEEKGFLTPAQKKKVEAEQLGLKVINEELNVISGNLSNIIEGQTSEVVDVGDPVKNIDKKLAEESKELIVKSEDFPAAEVKKENSLVKAIKSSEVYQALVQDIKTIAPMYRDVSFVLRSMYYTTVGFPDIVKLKTTTGEIIEVEPSSWISTEERLGHNGIYNFPISIMYGNTLYFHRNPRNSLVNGGVVRYGGKTTDGSAVIVVGGFAKKIPKDEFERVFLKE
jgi:hypothetical protein